MPQPLLILPPQTRSVFHRLWPGAMLGADAPMPRLFLILPSRTRSAFRRLWHGAMLGADAPMPRLLLILPPRTRSVFRRPGPVQCWALSPRCYGPRAVRRLRTRSALRRLRPGAMLGAASPMLWTACCAATADTQCPSPALARRSVGAVSPDAMDRVLCGDCGHEVSFAGFSPALGWELTPPDAVGRVLCGDCGASAFHRLWPGVGLSRRIHDAATASNLAAPDTKRPSPAPARRRVGRYLPDAVWAVRDTAVLPAKRLAPIPTQR